VAVSLLVTILFFNDFLGERSEAVVPIIIMTDVPHYKIKKIGNNDGKYDGTSVVISSSRRF
jgi:hypothetical protein